MPLPPYTWQFDDFLTANRLNAELRRTNGQPFLANGVGWHTQRPVYKGSWISSQVPSAETWLQFETNGAYPWRVVADSGAWLGGKLDIDTFGQVSGNFVNGGGAQGSNGGLGLAFTTIAAAAVGGRLNAALGYSTGSSPFSFGTIQLTNANYLNAAYAIDIVDWGTSPVTGYYKVSNNSLQLNASQTDGSGIVSRLEALWASAYPANGHTVASVPSITTGYTSVTPLTSAGLNAQIAATMNLLNMPPLLRVRSTAGQAYVANANAAINYDAPTYDTYGAWNSGTNTYTAPLSGLYLVASFAGFDSFSGATSLRAGVQINGANYYGPVTQTSASFSANASKLQIFSLNAGDTIKGLVNCGLSGSVATGTSQPLLLVLYLGAKGTPSPLPSVPDFTYLFGAGTPASQMPGVLNANMANDLSFLLQRPYLMAFQNAAQSGIAMATPTTVQLQSATDQIHGDNGDNYSGWTSGASNKYTAQRSGWYLAVAETFMDVPSLTTSPQYAQCFALSQPGASAADYYQKQNASTAALGGGGAAGISLYYLRAGDTITPQVWTNGTSATTTATAVANGNSHMELVWIAA